MDLSGWVGIELGGNFDCRCGIVMLLRWVEGGVVFAGLVGLTSFPYSSETFCSRRGLVCLQGFATCGCA